MLQGAIAVVERVGHAELHDEINEHDEDCDSTGLSVTWHMPTDWKSASHEEVHDVHIDELVVRMMRRRLPLD